MIQCAEPIKQMTTNGQLLQTPTISPNEPCVWSIFLSVYTSRNRTNTYIESKRNSNNNDPSSAQQVDKTRIIHERERSRQGQSPRMMSAQTPTSGRLSGWCVVSTPRASDTYQGETNRFVIGRPIFYQRFELRVGRRREDETNGRTTDLN